MSAIEYAAAGSDRYVSHAIDRAPPHIRRSINAARIARGLRPVLGATEYAALDQAATVARAAAEAAEGQRVGVWINGPDGRLVPATPGTPPPRPRRAWPSSSTSRPATRQGGRGPLLQARVLMMSAYGLARAEDTGRQLDERLAPGALGPAEALNTKRAWTLRGGGHHGFMLEAAGDRLRAIDTPAGTAIAWEPDLANILHRDAVRDIEAGHRALSVEIGAVERRVISAPDLHELIVAADLRHIALLGRSGGRPCYPASTALVFRGVWRDDPDELRLHIDKLIAECRFQANRLGR